VTWWKPAALTIPAFSAATRRIASHKFAFVQGRAKGYPKTGGRQKGGVDKIKREAILAAQGITPLDYMLGIVRNEEEDKTARLDAAKAAAPYIHARLQTTTLAGDPEKPSCNRRRPSSGTPPRDRTHRRQAVWIAVRQWPDKGMGEDEEPGFSAQLTGDKNTRRLQEIH
jgi:hypothetical protein